ncbi:MAG: hypothetical protein ACI9WS_000299, partial [Paraglaciecola psychrophila]
GSENKQAINVPDSQGGHRHSVMAGLKVSIELRLAGRGHTIYIGKNRRQITCTR